MQRTLDIGLLAYWFYCWIQVSDEIERREDDQKYPRFLNYIILEVTSNVFF